MSIEVNLQAVTSDVAAKLASDRPFEVAYMGVDLAAALAMGSDRSWRPQAKLGDYLCLGTDWQAAHWLISHGEKTFANDSKAEPGISRAIMNANEFGTVNTGYGRIRLNDQADVARCAQALAQLDLSQLDHEAEADRMNAAKVYPPNLTRSAEDIEALLDVVTNLTRFYEQAAADAKCVIIWAD